VRHKREALSLRSVLHFENGWRYVTVYSEYLKDSKYSDYILYSEYVLYSSASRKRT
jgi:hypothetical protein